MPPFQEQEPAEASTSKTKLLSANKRLKYPRNSANAPNVVPGVQKLKAALRQTRRLLAKDGLAADLRVETERRLRVLEADLQAAEVAKKERTIAIRYHKIKFFERQKVIRKIKQVQNHLRLEQTKCERKKLTLELQELRINLNYVLHYPKLKKYISLFPPEARKGDAVSDTSPPETQTTKAEREEIRTLIRDRMENGRLPLEPEITLGLHRLNEPTRLGSRPRDHDKSVSETKLVKRKGTIGNVVEEDEFFGEDDDSEDGVVPP